MGCRPANPAPPAQRRESADSHANGVPSRRGTARALIVKRRHGLRRRADLRTQAGQVVLNSLPDDVEVHLEIAVRQRIAHLIGGRQRKMRMTRRKRRAMLLDIAAGLADNLQVADHGSLHQRIAEEGVTLHVPRVTVDALDGFEDVRQVYLPALRHRILLNFEAQAENVSPDTVLEEILGDVKEKAADAAMLVEPTSVTRKG